MSTFLLNLKFLRINSIYLIFFANVDIYIHKNKDYGFPNQTIELKEREINWISKKSEYVGEAKCSHHITKGVYISDSKFSGTGVAKIVIKGYSALLKGQEKGFIKINWAK